MATGPSPSPDMFTFILTTPFSSEKTIIPETLLPFFDSIVAIAFFVLGPEQAAKITMHVNIRGLLILFRLAVAGHGFSSLFPNSAVPIRIMVDPSSAAIS